LLEVAAKLGFDPLVAEYWEQLDDAKLKVAFSCFTRDAKRFLAPARHKIHEVPRQIRKAHGGGCISGARVLGKMVGGEIVFECFRARSRHLAIVIS